MTFSFKIGVKKALGRVSGRAAHIERAPAMACVLLGSKARESPHQPGLDLSCGAWTVGTVLSHLPEPKPHKLKPQRGAAAPPVSPLGIAAAAPAEPLNPLSARSNTTLHAENAAERPPQGRFGPWRWRGQRWDAQSMAGRRRPSARLWGRRALCTRSGLTDCGSRCASRS